MLHDDISGKMDRLKRPYRKWTRHQYLLGFHVSVMGLGSRAFFLPFNCFYRDLRSTASSKHTESEPAPTALYFSPPIARPSVKCGTMRLSNAFKAAPIAWCMSR